MTYQLEGKVVFITGPARGIGAETARRLASRGARLSLVGLEPELLAALASELGEGHVWFECDVTDQAALGRAAAGTVEALGRIDVVIANAGVACNGTVAVGPVEALVRTIDVNLTGVVRTVCATLAHVVESRGYYLLVSSAAALAPFPGISTYAAAKSGVEQFGNVLRLELAHKGVAVGVAHPSWIDTDMVRDAREDLAGFSEMLGKLPGPFGRVTPLGDCAEAFVRAVERRKRKVYVPRTLAAAAVLRQLFMSPLADYLMGRQTRKTLPRVEAEVRALGRSFGAHSCGLGAKAGDGETRKG
ncbi:MAG: SDR family oxidoreductase [Acidobacteria bacterium]|nr:SDR family oxidoreductase [Acidobacteriota bacterium]MCA1620652.1 SDR family oxidoreductase [Acidobacteriota bacterium]